MSTLNSHLDLSSNLMAEAFELSERGNNVDASQDPSFNEPLETTEYDRKTLIRLGKNPVLKVS